MGTGSGDGVNDWVALLKTKRVEMRFSGYLIKWSRRLMQMPMLDKKKIYIQAPAPMYNRLFPAQFFIYIKS